MKQAGERVQLFSRRRDPTVPLDGADALLADLDGVVYVGQRAVPHAVEMLNRVATTIPVGYITNNASRTDATVASHLRELGLDTRPEDVVTSPQAAVRLLAEHVPPGSTILVVGGEGLTREVAKAGFTVTRSADDAPAAVIQGFAPDVGWPQLAEASFALHAPFGETGIPWIATNTDWTIPVDRGIAPGNGALVSAVHSAVGRLPIVAGKPEVAIFDEARSRFHAQAPLVVGDRLDTDIKGANRANMRSALVLTGVDRAKHVLAARQDERPTFILEDLRGLFEPYTPATIDGRGDAVAGSARVRLEGNRVRVVRTSSPIELLRAACALVWSSTTSIHALDVPEELYR